MANEFSATERIVGELVELRFSLNVSGEQVPGVAFFPADNDEPMPLVLIQHPGTGSKDDYFVRDVGMLWARRGWICAGLDAPFHGERAEYDPMGMLRNPERLAGAAVQFATEVTAAINALADRYPVDVERLGYVGYSMGSMLGIPAVASDGRFRAAAFCLIGEGGVVGEAAAEGSHVSKLGGVAVRIVAKSRDEYFSKESTEALYAGLSGKKDLAWFPGGHFEIGPEVIDSAGSWLVAEL